MTTPAQIRILTVDDHPLLLEGLAAVIQSQPDMLLVGQASNCDDGHPGPIPRRPYRYYDDV
jgi:DNA-binding NarL/FixJ family response regulator